MKNLALGTAMWGWTVDKEICFKMLDLFYESGERYIDTACNYPINGLSKDRYASENIIAEWIKINGVNDLNIIYKLGSITNTNTPKYIFMKRFINIFALSVILWAHTCPAASHIDGFALIKGGAFKRSTGAIQAGALVNLEDFEILDHPVTNAEYCTYGSLKSFIELV